MKKYLKALVLYYMTLNRDSLCYSRKEEWSKAELVTSCVQDYLRHMYSLTEFFSVRELPMLIPQIY